MCLGPYFPHHSSLPLFMLGEPTPLDEWEVSKQNRFIESKREKELLKQSRLSVNPTAVRRLAKVLKGWR